MLAQAARTIERQEFIVFQVWAPHPMNTVFLIRYLTAADAHYGPNFGAATVSTQVRKGYVADCPFWAHWTLWPKTPPARSNRFAGAA